MAGAPSSVQWSLGGEPLVAPLLSGPRWCSTTKKQQRPCTQNKGGLGGGGGGGGGVTSVISI